MSEAQTPKRVSRRTVAKGAAWTVPAIAVASATPALAASGDIITLTGAACKLPGGSAAPYSDGAVYIATITNPTNLLMNIVIKSFSRGVVSQNGSQVAVIKLSSQPAGACCSNIGVDVETTTTFTVAANSVGTYALVTEDWGSSGTAPLAVKYSVDGVDQPDATGAEATLNPIPGGNCGTGGSCTDLTVAQRLCVTKATGAEGCTTGDCS